MVYYEANINSGELDYSQFSKEKISLNSVAKEKLENFIEKVNSLYGECCPDTEESILVDESMENELTSIKAGQQVVLKHLYQQASLIGQLRQQGLLQPDTVFVEFGAGRGMLSHWLQKALPECRNNDFLLVDRASNRYKFDSYHRGEHQGPSFQRLNLDIEHLNLGKVPCVADQSRNVVAASKHLCGAATDLSLRCLLETTTKCHVCSENEDGGLNEEDERQAKRQRTTAESSSSHVAGLVFALCCHHRCNWPHYVGREFMCKLGLGPNEFHLLCCLSSWATCGIGLRGTGGEQLQDFSSDKGDLEESVIDSDYHARVTTDGSATKGLSLTTAEKEEVGRRCKRLIDAGRVFYLKSRGFKAVLIKYISPTVSLENVALVAIPKER